MSLAIHTNAPILPLTRMIGDTATIEVGRAAGTDQPDCFAGWAERQHENCEPHHIVWGMDDEETKWVAHVLTVLGYQVVVTAPDVFGDQYGDHHVVEEMPMRYTMDHSH